MTRTIVPRVSDHAMLRYFERVYGLDLDALRAEILTPEIAGQIAAGAVTVTIRGHKAPVQNGCIATILPKDARPSGTQRDLRHERKAVAK